MSGEEEMEEDRHDEDGRQVNAEEREEAGAEKESKRKVGGVVRLAALVAGCGLGEGEDGDFAAGEKNCGAVVPFSSCLSGV